MLIAVDVPVARPAKVDHIEFMGLEDAHRVGPDQEAVRVEVLRGVVVVVVKADLGRVAGEEEVLAVVVGDEDVLPPVVEGVQLAVGVLLRRAK